MPAASWRRPEAETRTRLTRRRRYGRLEAPGRCATAAPELQEHPTPSHGVGGGRRRPDLRRRRRNVLGEERAIAGERERKRRIERARGVYIGPAILLEVTGRQEVERLRSLPRTRGDTATWLQRREVEGGADRRDPPVSGRSEAARSDSNASGLGGAASLRDAVALGRKRRDPIQRWASDRTAHNR